LLREPGVDARGRLHRHTPRATCFHHLKVPIGAAGLRVFCGPRSNAQRTTRFDFIRLRRWSRTDPSALRARATGQAGRVHAKRSGL